jgi:uncharacterized protein (DUF2141 family)
MKAFLSILVFQLFGFAVQAQNASLVVEIPQLTSAQGNLLISVFNSPDGFPENPDKASAISMTTVQQGVNKVIFDLAPGIYAVAVVHDVNGNGELDTNSFGLPLEPVGFSNDPTLMGKPTFDQTKFSVVAPTTTKAIKVKKLFTPL